MKEQNHNLQIVYRDYDQDIKKKSFDLEKEYKDMYRARIELENDIKSLTTNL